MRCLWGCTPLSDMLYTAMNLSDHSLCCWRAAQGVDRHYGSRVVHKTSPSMLEGPVSDAGSDNHHLPIGVTLLGNVLGGQYIGDLLAFETTVTGQGPECFSPATPLCLSA